jgi:hypothetical protein
MRIIRHQIAITDYQEIDLPSDGKLLSVAQVRTPVLVNHALDVWSIDYQRGNGRTVAIHVVGTGNPMAADLAHQLAPEPGTAFPVAAWSAPRDSFLGTVVTPNELVWHVFEGTVR